MRVHLVLPPLTQLNTPYPSTAYLSRALAGHGIATEQYDLGLALVLKLCSRAGLAQLFPALAELAETQDLDDDAWRAIALQGAHERAMDGVIRFLQGRDRGLGPRILETPFLPRTPRIEAAAASGELGAFGALAIDDAARRLATLYLADIADLWARLDPGFALSHYQRHLATGPVAFSGLAERLQQTTLVDVALDALVADLPVQEGDLVGLSVPFPGNLYGALRIGRALRQRGATVLLGGGYANTELRNVSEPALWSFVDAVCLDDGEGPLLAWIRWMNGEGDARHRTITASGRLENPHPDEPAACAASYGALPLGDYLQLVDSINPTHRLWGDGRWNKLTVAHGCYWKKCSFCDIQLDYIAGFRPHRTAQLADAMVELIATTGQSGFHLVDEAVPPRGMRDLALTVLERGIGASFWGNIRFERAWTPDLARLCAHAGLIAVTGGLEVASPRILEKMQKGVTIEQVVRAALAFRAAGVRVHAYLMYGFPTQTDQESIDAMETVRQMFAAGVLDSAFWHRFVLTRHSGMSENPESWGMRVPVAPRAFAENDVDHEDPLGGRHDAFDDPLAKALSAWMRGDGLDAPLQSWFTVTMPATSLAADYVATMVAADEPATSGRLLWTGGEVLEADDEAQGGLLLHHIDGVERVRGPRRALEWLAEVIGASTPAGEGLRLEQVLPNFPGDFSRFQRGWAAARRAGLLVV